MEEAKQEGQGVCSAAASEACASSSLVLVSVVVPMHNAEAWIGEALASVAAQTHRPLECIVYDDASTDGSAAVVRRFIEDTEEKRADPATKDESGAEEGEEGSAFRVVLVENLRSAADGPGGIGFARNRAVEASRGECLAFLDSDDVMFPQRVEKQLRVAMEDPTGALVGCNFERQPCDSTPYYTDWINNMTEQDLILQQYRELTIICPTWFCSRAVFDAVPGGFPEQDDSPDDEHVPEDLIFFNDHLERGGRLRKVPETLLMYRYHDTGGSACSRCPKRLLQRARVPYVERRLLTQWPRFTIWGFGKDAKAIFRMLSNDSQRRVRAFCDVDEGKVGRVLYAEQIKAHIPVLAVADSEPPYLVCVASKRYNGQLERNLAAQGLTEGVDYVHFC